MICAAALCAGSTLNPAWAQSAEDDPLGKHLAVPGAKTTLPVEVVKEPSIINLNHKPQSQDDFYIQHFAGLIGAQRRIGMTQQSKQQGPFDLVIKNGRVMDPETMYDAVANVGVKDGRIAVITKDDITGQEDH